MIKFKKVVFILVFIGIVWSISSVNAGVNPVVDPELSVELGDVVKFDHLFYTKDMASVIEGNYNVFLNMTEPLENWQLGMIGMSVGENKSYMGTEFGGCVHYIEILGILRIEIPVDDSDAPIILVNPEVDEFLNHVGTFATENWFELLVSGLALSYLGYKIFAK